MSPYAYIPQPLLVGCIVPSEATLNRATAKLGESEVGGGPERRTREAGNLSQGRRICREARRRPR
ncbi:hypothetical protein, partial [Calderihabitans maritimus]|uniref:hypothetical protein n=1 Tax=Calderihabitans maritimus TaxID=1246530 RepID=UPI001EDF90D4